MNILRTIERGGISLVEAQHMAPSLFAEQAHESRSSRYKFYPTAVFLENLVKNEGWRIIELKENRTRVASKEGFQRHSARLYHPDHNKKFSARGDRLFNIVLQNAHDGTSALKAMMASLELDCTNGLFHVCDKFEAISIPHTRTSVEDAVNAVYRIVDTIPELGDTINHMRAITLNDDERMAYARAARELRWESEIIEVPNPDNPEIIEVQVKNTSPIEAEQLLRVKRNSNMGRDLYTTYNVIQEHVISGGVDGRTLATNKPMTTREVKSVTESTKLNRALWVLAREMEKLKAN